MSAARLKKGWRMVKFGDVVRNANLTERDPQKNGIDRVVGLEHIDPENLHIRRWNSIDDGTSFTRKFVPGQTLFGKRRAYQRKVAYAEFEGICSGDILTFEPKDSKILLPELLPFICQTDAFFDHALGTSAGSLSPRTSWTALKNFEFPLPSIEEQNRIAEILWAADETIEKYDKSIYYLKGVMSVECNAIFEENFEKKTIQQLIDEGILMPPQDGNHGNDHPKAKDYTESGVPFVMASNLINNKIDLETCKFLPKKLTDRLRIGFALEGDVLLSHKGTIGGVAIVPHLETPYIMLTPQVTYYRIIKTKQLNPKFLFYCFLSKSFQRILSRWSGQSTRAYVGITAQRQFVIPFPNITIQEEIIEKLEMISDKIEAIKNHKEYLAKLDKKILNQTIGAVSYV